MPGLRVAAAEDGDLVAWSRQGDAAAFEELVRRHSRLAYTVAKAILRNRADAEDVCQESWMRALRHLEECRQPDRFLFWFLQIVRNRARNQLQHDKVRAAAPLESIASLPARACLAGDAGSSGDLLEWELDRSALTAALRALPGSYREVLLLHDVEGLKHRSIAERIGISEVLSRQRLFQARSQLRRMLREDFMGGPAR